MTRNTPLRPASRRIVLALTAVLSIGLAACGSSRADESAVKPAPAADQTATSTAGGPRVIRAGARAGAESATAAAAPAADAATGKIAASWFAPTTYVWAGTSEPLDGPSPSWYFPTGGTPSAEQFAALAAAFGLSGEFTPLSPDLGGGWSIGSTDGTGAGLTVSGDGMLSWYYNPDPSVYGAVGACAEPAVAPGETAPPPACPEPQPPAGVPTADEAKAKAEALFAVLGLDMTQHSVEVAGDEWGRVVTAYRMLDGRKMPTATSISYGANGAVTWSNGFLAEPVRGDDYPRIGVEAAVARLGEQGMWRGGIEPMPLAVAEGSAVASGSATAEVPASDGAAAPSGDAVAGDPGAGAPAPGAPVADGSGGAAVDVAPIPCVDVLPADGGPLVDPAVDPAVGAPADAVVAVAPAVDPAAAPVDACTPPEPITVTLTGVQEDLTMIWDVDGTVWLLPAYTFTSDDGGQYQVTAIDDAFLQYDDPLPIDAGAGGGGGDVVVSPDAPPPAPLDPATESPAGTVVPPTPEGAAEVLIGKSQADAEAAAIGSQWTMRVARLDGEDLAVTADFSPTRVNVAVADGVVTEVLSIG